MDQAPTPHTTPPHASAAGRALLLVVGAVAVAALASSVLLWQRLSNVQTQLARQSADSGTQAVEARTMARQAQELAREASAKVTVLDTRVSEVALQRSQLEELMHSLSRSRDENLVVDVEAAVRLAQQQSQLTGSLQPLVATLKSASARVERAAQPRLAPVLRAMAHDLERLESANVTDTAGLLGRLDELAGQVDELPLLADVARASTMRRQADGAGTQPAADAAAPDADAPAWRAALQRTWQSVRDASRDLVRVRRIDQPDAMLITPDQAFFLRENFKLKLLNVRLGLLARRMEPARSDLATAVATLNRYFDPASRRTQRMATALQQLQAHMQTAQQPQLDDTFAALATAAAGR